MSLPPTLDADVPLRWRTPAAWAAAVLRDPLALLSDHAHLEKKAALNALELIGRCPADGPEAAWTAVLAGVARDESEHLAAVVRLLSRRGGRLSRSHRNPYANELRRLVRLGRGRDELVDRLLVSALIEARSCERFALLAEASREEPLGRLYRRLCVSEHGHHRVFLELARRIAPAPAVDERWATMLDREAESIRRQPPGPSMHSGA